MIIKFQPLAQISYIRSSQLMEEISLASIFLSEQKLAAWCWQTNAYWREILLSLASLSKYTEQSQTFKSGNIIFVWGIAVQTSFWEDRWHQNCGYKSPILFWGYGQRNLWKTDFFRKSLRTWKFVMGKLFGAYIQKILTHSAFRKILLKIQKKNWDPVLFAKSWVSVTKCGPLAKIIKTKNKMSLPKFSNLSLQT